MRLNLSLVRASWFLQQFKLNICYKVEKKHIILNIPSCLTCTTVSLANLSYLKLNILFTYNATLVKIYPTLILQILAKY